MPQFPSYLQRVNSASKTTRSSYFLLFPSIPTVISRSQEEGNHQAKAITHISIASRPRDTEQKAALPDPFSPHNTDTEPDTAASTELPQAPRGTLTLAQMLLQAPRAPSFHHTSPAAPASHSCHPARGEPEPQNQLLTA